MWRAYKRVYVALHISDCCCIMNGDICSFHWISRWLKTKYLTPDVSWTFLMSFQFEKPGYTLLFLNLNNKKNFSWYLVFSLLSVRWKEQTYGVDIVIQQTPFSGTVSFWKSNLEIVFCSCLRELGKQVTNTWKKLWAWYKSRQL